MLDKPDDTEKKPSMPCEVRGCPDNLFGYCQGFPDIDRTGRCKKAGGKNENRD